MPNQIKRNLAEGNIIKDIRNLFKQRKKTKALNLKY